VIFVADLAHLEETAVGADIGLLELLRPVDDSGSGGTGNSVVVSLTETAENSAVSFLKKEMLGQIGYTLLGDNDIGFVDNDGLAHSHNFSLLHGKGLFEILLVGELHVRHRLTLLVLKRAIEKDNTGVGNLAAHVGMAHVLVEHDTVEDAAVFESSAGNLLDLGVALGIDFDIISVFLVNGADCLDSEIDDKVAPPGSELGADAALHDLGQIIVVFHVNGDAEVVGELDDLLECLEIGGHNHGGVDVFLKEAFDGSEDLASEHDDRGGAISDFLLLSAAQLNH